MKTNIQSSKDEMERYELEIESLKNDLFWSQKEHEMKMRKINAKIEEVEGYLKSEREVLESYKREGKWLNEHQQKTLRLE